MADTATDSDRSTAKRRADRFGWISEWIFVLSLLQYLLIMVVWPGLAVVGLIVPIGGLAGKSVLLELRQRQLDYAAEPAAPTEKAA